MNNKIWQCPRCKNHTQGHGATSRRDGKTMICSICGSEEAMFDFSVAEAKSKGLKIAEDSIQQEKSWLIAKKTV
jgi:transcription elongation factor Elf1